MQVKQGVYAIKGVVQHYDWGGTDFIPALLGQVNAAKKPYAEYWMGSHPKSPSELITENGNRSLADRVQLPFLFKVLDVHDMLSIQVHPTKAAAELEFARENSEKIPLDSPKRNYRDENHKPELAYALSEFWLLHGFKPEHELLAILRAVPEFAGLHDWFLREGYLGLYKKVMGMPQDEVNTLLQPLLDRIVPLYEKGVLHREEEDYWAARAAITFNRNGQCDRGIFSVYFFNIVKLEPGEAIFQDAGIPHAYLFGQCMELMANSDNVLRGGLTSKHIDVKELMKHVKCEPLEPKKLPGAWINGAEKVFETPAPDFQLSEVRLNAGGEEQTFISQGPEIWFNLSGSTQFTCQERELTVQKGEAVYVEPGMAYTLLSATGSRLFKAGLPHSTKGE
ncbi:MAG: mannose-6-phosphate isomerase, class I [Chitinophagales bacterium]|nr:mannose-6-phosphate isomerase, class I [Chitinophagales bacterium]